jgi:hypothetical protein
VTAGDRVTELRVSPSEVAPMQAAAAVVAACRNALAASGGDILGETAAGEETFADWRHYPAGEVYDPKSHAQYFYHTHPAVDQVVREHGHFHTFLRAEGMPPGVTPLVLPETAVADAARPPPQAAPLKHGARDEVSHLVAIALDPYGEPIRLFTTNRWVTGETWYRAEDVILMLERFTVGEVGRSAVLNRWVSAILALFRPQIVALLTQRDATVMAWRRRRRTNVLEDPRLEITSSIDVDLSAQLAFLDRAGPGTHADESARLSRLPPMAEGWAEGYARRRAPPAVSFSGAAAAPAVRAAEGCSHLGSFATRRPASRSSRR